METSLRLMLERNMSDFKQVQRAMTQYLRDPDNQPAPTDIEMRRLTVYKELIFNNVRSFVDNSFPVMKSLFAEADWSALVRRFLVDYRCESPLFQEISYEFLQFLPQCEDIIQAKPFILELAHYEWVEIAVMLGDVEAYSDVEIDQNELSLLGKKAVVSQNAWLLAYEYPVNQIRPDYQPTEKADTPVLIMVYRDKSDAVGFIKMLPATFVMAQLIESGEHSFSDIIEGLQAQFSLAKELVQKELFKSLQEWSEKGIILRIE
jgi:uncharacterized protein